MKRLLVLVLSLALTAAACSDSTGPGDSLTGTYRLESVNGASLPVRICDTRSCYDILSADITLFSNGRYESTNRYSNRTSSADGTWLLSGNDLLLIDSFDGYESYATISGRRLTFSVPNGNGFDIDVYTK